MVGLNGVFDGAGFLLANWTYSTAVAGAYIGLFATPQMQHNATVKNLIMANVNLTASGALSYMGAIFAGEQANNGTWNLTNITVTGNMNLNANGYIGGLVGYTPNYGHWNFTNINSQVNVTSTGTGYVAGVHAGLYNNSATYTNVVASGTITATNAGVNAVGGLVGLNGCGPGNCGNSILNSSFTGSIVSLGSSIGGIVGSYSGTISNSYSTGTITISSGGNVSNVGGLVGGMAQTGCAISTSYSTMNINLPIGTGSTYSSVGGFAGYYSGNISQSYSTGNIIGDLTHLTSAGGFLGYFVSGATTPSISDSYSTGNIQGNSPGGFVGSSNNTALTFARDFSTGEVITTTAGGGFMGTGATSNLIFTNVFWDTTTSTYSTTDGGGTGMNDANMKVQADFTGFDFVTTPVWKMSPVTGYPELNYQTP